MTKPEDRRVVRNALAKGLDTAAGRIADKGPAVTALLGSLGDLVARAEGRPIYCTTPWCLVPISNCSPGSAGLIGRAGDKRSKLGSVNGAGARTPKRAMPAFAEAT